MGGYLIPYDGVPTSSGVKLDTHAVNWPLTYRRDIDSHTPFYEAMSQCDIPPDEVAKYYNTYRFYDHVVKLMGQIDEGSSQQELLDGETGTP